MGATRQRALMGPVSTWPAAAQCRSSSLVPKHFLVTVCLQGQARNPGREETPWDSQPEDC